MCVCGANSRASSLASCLLCLLDTGSYQWIATAVAAATSKPQQNAAPSSTPEKPAAASGTAATELDVGCAPLNDLVDAGLSLLNACE